MQIIRFIEEAQLIRRILEHLGLRYEHAMRYAADGYHYQYTPAYQPFDDGWGGCDEPRVTLN